MDHIKMVIARQYQIHKNIIKLYNKGFEMPDDIIVAAECVKGEILYFTINLPHIHIINIKIDFVYEKYYSL